MEKQTDFYNKMLLPSSLWNDIECDELDQEMQSLEKNNIIEPIVSEGYINNIILFSFLY